MENNIVINKETAVSFTGYRTMKIAQSTNRPDLLGQISSVLYTQIKTLNEQGYTTFLSGMSEGFDMIAAEAVLALRDEGYGVKLIAVVPYMGQELRYNERDKARYKTIIESADQMILISEFYTEGCFLKRNDYLLANCSTLVCYYSGLRGGTMYTYNRAQKANLPIINIFNVIQAG